MAALSFAGAHAPARSQRAHAVSSRNSAVLGAPVAPHGLRAAPRSSRASFAVHARGGGGSRGNGRPSFNPETMEVLGIPGVQISPEQQILGEMGQATTSTSKKMAAASLVTLDGSSLLDKGKEKDGTGAGGALGMDEDDEPDMALELAWDPEGVLSADIDSNLISNREAVWAERAEELSEEEKEEERKKREEERKKLQDFRDGRLELLATVKEDLEGLTEYFLTTEFNEIEFEMTRARPHMTEEWFASLQAKIDNPGDDEQLTIKHKILMDAASRYTKFIDANAKALAAPAERLRKLLTSEDKKAMIYEMAGNNEIDKPLLALLKTNINNAIEADQIKPAAFMQKIYDACIKFAR